MYISNKVMGALLREYKDQEFGVVSYVVNDKGIAIFTLEFMLDTCDDIIQKEVYIQYDHEDKEFYSKVVEIL